MRKNADGEPDFHYVATHVCDSVKRRLKAQGAGGLQGEFGIGLLSFWTLGEDLLLTSAGNDGRAYQMHLSKGDPSYRITHRPALFPEPGTEVLIKGILPGIKNFSGEKIQFDAPYLNLTPGTRQGVIHDAALARLAEELAPLESRLAKIIEDQQRAEEERASRDVLRSVQGALKEALLALPAEEYDWFDLHRGEGKRRPRTLAESTPAEVRSADDQAIARDDPSSMIWPTRGRFSRVKERLNTRAGRSPRFGRRPNRGLPAWRSRSPRAMSSARQKRRSR